MCERPIPAPDPAQTPDQAGSPGQHPYDGDGLLADLEYHWGSAYHLAVVGGMCTARRRDGQGGTLVDPLPEGLRLRILADYAARPVPRDLP